MNENIGHQSMLPLTYLAKADLEHGIHLLMQMAEERLQDLQYAPNCYPAPNHREFCGGEYCDVCNEARDLLAAIAHLRDLHGDK